MTLALRLTRAQVLRPDGLSGDPVTIAGGWIEDVPVRRDVDLSGFMVLPGIVDIHGDGFERHLAPRRGAMKDMRRMACSRIRRRIRGGNPVVDRNRAGQDGESRDEKGKAFHQIISCVERRLRSQGVAGI